MAVQSRVMRQATHAFFTPSVEPSNTQQIQNDLPFPSRYRLFLLGTSRLKTESILQKFLIYLKLEKIFYIFTVSFFANHYIHAYARPKGDDVCLCAIGVCMDESFVVPSSDGSLSRGRPSATSEGTMTCSARPLPPPPSSTSSRGPATSAPWPSGRWPRGVHLQMVCVQERGDEPIACPQEQAATDAARGAQAQEMHSVWHSSRCALCESSMRRPPQRKQGRRVCLLCDQ
jgi:hypothetical protein